MLIYQCPNNSEFPKFMSKTPSTVPVSIGSWIRNNERQKTYMLQEKIREKLLPLEKAFCLSTLRRFNMKANN